jgi:hypothetical protein
MIWLDYLLAGKAATPPELATAITRAVDRVEPRLKYGGGYPERYRDAVAAAMAYSVELAGRIPGPVRINRESYVRDPLVHALFASPDDFHVAFCASRAMHDYRRDYPEAGEVYGLICMRRSTKSLLGCEMQGDQLRRDVPQQAVCFSGHTLADVANTEAEARARIADGVFDSLVDHVRLRIEARVRERADLENRCDELRAAIRLATPDKRVSLDVELRGLLGQLSALVPALMLDRYAEDFDAVLRVPEQYVFIDRQTMILDAMGILRSSDSEDGQEVEFCDLIGRDRRLWTVALMHCDRVRDEGSMETRLAAAERWLGM